VKARLEACLQELLAPIRRRRQEFAAAPDDLLELLRDGTESARQVAGQTAHEVKSALGLKYFRSSS
jgi:tryptophanyl-tRNA synthetase